MLHIEGQLVPSGAGGSAKMLHHGLQGLLVVGRGGPGPGQDGSVAQRQRGVRHDLVGVDFLLGAQTIANRAGAEGIVEREQPRLDLGNGEA